MISLNAPQIGKEEIEAAVKVMKSGVLTNKLGAGPLVTKFEKGFAKLMEAKHAIAMNTGTAALHSSTVAAELKPGDEVILPSFTFISTAEVVVMTRARPVFVDINPETYNISLGKIEEAITEKTKAVFPVDLYGLPADMKEIREIADKHGLFVIEDAAQAHGSSYKGKPPGVFADVACWSFYASKNMTTGEGGMVTTNNGEIAEKLRFMRSHGEKEEYKSVMLGHNYHMSEIHAAIGCVQLARLPEFVARRRENASRLTAMLSREPKLQLPRQPKGYKHGWYLYTVRLKNGKRKQRDRVVEGLRKKSIGTGAYYANPIHLMPYYSRFSKGKLPETEKASQQVFSLPVHPGVTAEQIDIIGESVLHLLK